jgi:hypothetical protein
MTSTLCRHDLDVGGGLAEEHLTPVGLVDENCRNFPQNLKSGKIAVHTSGAVSWFYFKFRAGLIFEI